MKKTIPYGRQSIDESDIQAVVDVLKSDWLTTGPAVEAFENAVGDFVGAKEAVAVSSGTAALHAAMYAIGIGPGDEVIVPPMTFAATANAVVFQQGKPVFSDVDSNSLLIDPALIEKKITPQTKAIIAVDYAGQPCDYDLLRKIADHYNLTLVADACHSLGAEYKGRRAGTLADLNIFSFHPVKHITTGEGGMVTTDNHEFAKRMRIFRNHCIDVDHMQRAEKGTWFYEMVDLGYNYRITDFQCALGVSQLKKLPAWIKRRQEIALRYDLELSKFPAVMPLSVATHVCHAYHLYVIRLQTHRSELFAAFRNAGINVNIHYIPVHLHPYYRKHFKTSKGLCPNAERAYNEIISLPMFPGMQDEDIMHVVSTLQHEIRKLFA